MLSLCGKAAGLIWWELHYCRNGKDFCHHRKETLNSIWILPDDLACHLGVNNALKSGSGSCSIDILCFADCNHQNSDVRVLCNLPQFQSQCCYLVCVRVNSFFGCPNPVCRPTYSVLGNVPGTELYVDVETHGKVTNRWNTNTNTNTTFSFWLIRNLTIFDSSGKGDSRHHYISLFCYCVFCQCWTFPWSFKRKG